MPIIDVIVNSILMVDFHLTIVILSLNMPYYLLPEKFLELSFWLLFDFKVH